MNIVWDEDKNTLPKNTRHVWLDLVAEILSAHTEVRMMENPVHKGQVYYLVWLNDYIHVVPAVINTEGQIALKTIFPSRKYQKLFGGKHD
jgi:hypothetical protein